MTSANNTPDDLKRRYVLQEQFPIQTTSLATKSANGSFNEAEKDIELLQQTNQDLALDTHLSKRKRITILIYMTAEFYDEQVTLIDFNMKNFSSRSASTIHHSSG
ncbi:unnamed protein product [Rotaria magnacalcarata]|uniref:Uncharacterized protein n=1 Tax=Rotaria magnacalcarata TaxID=392030 RepID=A0A818XQW1_9BILA|nr:unnamed protein product [Rotaria magnacalcarata]CAF3817567.1 unnamed protein product [Rotaria magnacalcarata]